MWTPPHFWALALYRAATTSASACRCCRSSPARGETRRQILIYSLLLVPLAVAPALIGLGGIAYARRVGRCSAPCSWRSPARSGACARARAADQAAKQLFGFSILYLFLLFAVLLVEHRGGGLLGVMA